ncbi:hypothetical protein NK718_12885 [Alsobacter sp. SYSU M60028]|uniref:Uncharacterized protein n=1 Tax=Alsobacter ponti TaxID=2962936 RepID=A0ABT1LET2_9HYPH|nr:hypothetical protein [Alsobacter ponti]MCP8939413.1 hypothetical protein [Alsobacter ponti]
MRSLIVIALVMLPTTTFADQKQAATCAAGLPKDARLIYDASAPEVASKDLRAVVEDKTRALAVAGTIGKLSARSNAEAAGKCLVLARP